MKTIRESYELGLRRAAAGSGNGMADYQAAAREMSDPPQRDPFLKGWEKHWQTSARERARTNPAHRNPAVVKEWRVDVDGWEVYFRPSQAPDSWWWDIAAWVNPNEMDLYLETDSAGDPVDQGMPPDVWLRAVATFEAESGFPAERYYEDLSEGELAREVSAVHVQNELDRRMLATGKRDALPNPPRRVEAQRVVACVNRSFKVPAKALESPEDVVDALAQYIAFRPTEVFVVLYLSNRNKIVGYDEYASGDPTGVAVHPQGVFRGAILSGGVGLISAHNHPSGNPTPSQDDVFLWERLDKSAELLGYVFLEHMVLGSETYYSKSSDRTSRYPPALLAEANKGITRYPP